MDQIRDKALEGHNRPRNPGVPLDPDWFESVGVNASAVERRASTLTTRRSVKKEYQAAWLVKALDLHRSHDACRRRHARAGAPPLRQGEAAAERRTPRRARPRRRASDRRRGLRLSDDGRAGGPGARRLGHPGRLGRHRISGGPHAAQAAARRNPLRGRRRRARDRHRHHPRPCARPRLGGAL